MPNVTHIHGYLIVFFGAGMGGALRHAVNRLLPTTTAFPWSTLLVNISGSFTMGLIAGWFAHRSSGSGQMLPLFLTTGILGGYTTFSAYSLDAVLLWERGQPVQAALYAGGTVVLSLAGVFAGLALMRP
ncbi:MAG: fluoride efflux transporter CrcB [Gemmatimonadota bacterium]